MSEFIFFIFTVYFILTLVLYVSGTWEQGDEAAEDFFQRVSLSQRWNRHIVLEK